MTASNGRSLSNPEYSAWRKAVFERDNGLCHICGAKGEEVHHIIGWTKDPERRFDVNNGITLCLPCHRKTDNYFSWGFKRTRINRNRTVKQTTNVYKPIATIRKIREDITKAETEKPHSAKRGVRFNIACGLICSCLWMLIILWYNPANNIKWIILIIWSLMTFVLFLFILAQWLFNKSDK